MCAAPASVAGEDLYVVGQMGASSLPCDPATANYDPYNRHQHARHQHRAAVAKQEKQEQEGEGGGRSSGVVGVLVAGGCVLAVLGTAGLVLSIHRQQRRARGCIHIVLSFTS